MALIAKLKAFLGIGGSREEPRGTRVRVEQEPDAESERAVKEAKPDLESGSSDVAGSRSTSDGEPVDSLSGIGSAYSERLSEAGIETLAELASADATTLADATGIGTGRLEDWIERAGNR